jgi:hypothetical protein
MVVVPVLPKKKFAGLTVTLLLHQSNDYYSCTTSDLIIILNRTKVNCVLSFCEKTHIKSKKKVAPVFWRRRRRSVPYYYKKRRSRVMMMIQTTKNNIIIMSASSFFSTLSPPTPFLLGYLHPLYLSSFFFFVMRI